ncbi:ABC transporter permease subunit [Propylenella binzhouense]|uniref:ABC transporter permease subunit n=1 Tax=Propylenella binzhouense TaxID=2555902 RepID=UPI00136FDEC4
MRAAGKTHRGPVRQAVAIAGFIALLVVLWQSVIWVFGVPGYLLPTPGEVGAALVGQRDTFLQHAAVTMTEVVLGLGAGALLGLALAVVMDQSPVLNKALYVPILATQTTPIVAITPILIIWFGVGLAPKLMIIAIFSFFPVLVNTLAGLQATGRQMLLLLDSVAASPWQVYRYVRIPMALPHVFAGLRLAAAASVVGAIVVEWVSSTAGLGYLLILYQSRLNVSKAFATLVVLLVLGLLVFAFFAWIERRFSWQKRLGMD